jgi:hypothetical protein
VPWTRASDIVEKFAFVRLADGRVLAAWLDGRAKKSGTATTPQQLFARLVDPASGWDGPGALLVKNGKIADVVQGAAPEGLSDDVEAIVTAYRTGEDPDGEEQGLQLRLVSQSEVKKNGWDLSIGRSLRGAGEAAIDVGEALAALRMAQTELAAAQTRLDERLSEAGYA